ncbi:MAG: hypothetical protein ACXU8N_13510 [Telluria sp.]
MPIRRLFLQALACLALIVPVAARADRGPSTPEEQARVIQLAEASYADPVGTMTSADGRWFMRWSDEVPDYMFGPDAGAMWFENSDAKGDLRRVMRFQHMLSTAAFQLQHKMHDPHTNPADEAARTLAGAEGLLRAYETLVAKNPANRSADVDKLLALRNSGGLAAFLQQLPPPQRH